MRIMIPQNNSRDGRDFDRESEEEEEDEEEGRMFMEEEEEEHVKETEGEDENIIAATPSLNTNDGNNIPTIPVMEGSNNKENSNFNNKVTGGHCEVYGGMSSNSHISTT
jgi:hypothetical protein